MYHISAYYLGKKIVLMPKVPSTVMADEDNETARVCFAPSIEQCLLGIRGTKSIDKTYTGQYGYFLYSTEETLEPAGTRVPDFYRTNEHWSLKPVKVKFVGVVYFDKKTNILSVDYSRGELVKKELSKRTKEFIEKAKEKHGNRYDYSLVNVTRENRTVYIHCKKHGYVFKQLPKTHLSLEIPCIVCESIVNVPESLPKAVQSAIQSSWKEITPQI